MNPNKLIQMKIKFFIFFIFFVPLSFLPLSAEEPAKINVSKVLSRVQAHKFHPLNGSETFTRDRRLKKHGIADLKDADWQVRLSAVRDLVRSGSIDEIKKGLENKNKQVRYITAMSLGILKATGAIKALEKILSEDKIAFVRCQAAMALGQIEAKESLSLLQEKFKNDPSKDVRHQCELAIYQIKNKMGASKEQIQAFKSLEIKNLKKLERGKKAPDFSLPDTEGKTWKLSDFEKKNWVVLIWVFADWCPVCHGEFRELIKLKDDFQKAGVKVVTLECHDSYRGRVMVGKELEPKYWFSKKSFKKTYTEKIWWPHLLDRAGAVGVKYGIDPLAFAVHGEYINRPATVIIDKNGIVRFAYYGTYWGDRPSIAKTLNMIKTEKFEFKHPKRLKSPDK